jgi:uncharacterized protein YjiS (DUF1127 family)
MRFESHRAGDRITGMQGGKFAFCKGLGGRSWNRADGGSHQGDAELPAIVLEDRRGALIKLAPRCSAPSSLQRPLREAADRGSRQVQTGCSFLEPNTWGHRVRMVTSVVIECLTEGFALSAAAAYPAFFLLANDQAESERETRKRRPVPRSEASPSTRFGTVTRKAPARLEIPRTDFARRRTWISIAAELWSRIRRGRDRRRIRVAWETIDDRTLRDIGLSRYEIELLTLTGHYWSPSDADP